MSQWQREKEQPQPKKSIAELFYDEWCETAKLKVEYIRERSIKDLDRIKNEHRYNQAEVNILYGELVDKAVQDALEAFGVLEEVAAVACGSLGRGTSSYGADHDIFFLTERGDFIPAQIRTAVMSALRSFNLNIDINHSPGLRGAQATWLSVDEIAMNYDNLLSEQKNTLQDVRLINDRPITRRLFFDLRTIITDKIYNPQHLDEALVMGLLRGFIKIHGRDFTLNSEALFYQEVMAKDLFNVKHERGGSRELNIIIWIGRLLHGVVSPAQALEKLCAVGFLTPVEVAELKQAQKFLIRLRSEMNFLLEENRFLRVKDPGFLPLNREILLMGQEEVLSAIAANLGLAANELNAEIVRHRRSISRIGAEAGRKLIEFVRMNPDKFSVECRTYFETLMRKSVVETFPITPRSLLVEQSI